MLKRLRWARLGAVVAIAALPLCPAAAGPETAARLIAQSKAAMPADPAAAQRLAHGAELALRQAAATPDRAVDIATAQWLQGEALIRRNNLTDATPIVAEALATAARVAPGSKLHASLLSSQAGIDGARGRADRSLANYQRAFDIFRRLGDARAEAVALQNIGSIYQDAADYDRVLYYYGLASETFPHDPYLDLSSSNNRGNALDQLGRYREAAAEYQKARVIAAGLGDPALEARILDNLAQAQIRQGELKAAARNIARGLALVKGADAEGWYPLLLGTAARLAMVEKDNDRAVRLLTGALDAAGADADQPAYRDLHLTAYEAFKQRGDTGRSLGHFEIYKRLDDQARSLAASNSATLAAARFDFVNQNSRIARLKTGQLQRDIALTKLRTRQLQIVLGALLAIAVVVAAMLALYLRSLRRNRTAITAANVQLTDVNLALEEALQAKTQFLATTSHEIRTPLNGVLGMTQVLLADPSVAGDVRERVTLMHKAGETMRDLVDDILDSAKNDAEGFALNRAVMPLPELLQGSIEFWHDRAVAAGLDLRLVLDECPETIVEDQARLRQIVHNLIANAIKFTARGSVEVMARVIVNDGGERLLISVEDSGIGIAAADFSRIFEKFVQLDGSTTRQFGGTGLGLAICQRLARAMGGDVVVASEAGRGSRFTVSLPLCRGPATAAFAADPGAAPVATLDAARMIVIGASPLARGMMTAILSPRAASVRFADSLPAALDAVTTSAVDLVLLEGTTQAARGDAGLADVRALADTLAANGTRLSILWPLQDPGTAVDGLAGAGVCDVIFKPVAADELIARLQALMARLPALATADRSAACAA